MRRAQSNNLTLVKRAGLGGWGGSWQLAIGMGWTVLAMMLAGVRSKDKTACDISEEARVRFETRLTS